MPGISKKVFNDNFRKICRCIESDEFYNYLNKKEQGYYNAIIKPAIKDEKNLDYETMVFFLPLIRVDIAKIFNNSGSDTYMTIEEMHELIDRLEEAQNLLKDNFVEHVKNKLEKKKEKIRNNSKLYSSDKTIKIKQLEKEFNKEWDEINSEKREIYFISFHIYIKIYDFNVINVMDNNGIYRRIKGIEKYINRVPDIVKLNLIPKIEKLMFKEFSKYKGEKDITKDKYWDNAEIENIKYMIENEEIIECFTKKYEEKEYGLLMQHELAMEELEKQEGDKEVVTF